VRRAFLATLLLLPLCAAAQMVKCVDERGRTHYTDKPETDCKSAKSTTVISPGPTPPAPQAPKAAAKAPVAKAPAGKPPGKAPRQQLAQTADERARFLAECRTNQQLLDHLNSPRGQNAENRPARLEMIQKAMRGCP
jgi:hypothetical protein